MMEVKCLVVLLMLIGRYQGAVIDQNRHIISSGKKTSEIYKYACANQLQPQYYQSYEGYIDDIQSKFKTDANHLPLDIVYSIIDSPIPLTTKLSFFFGQLIQYISGILVGILTLVVIFMLWIWRIIKRRCYQKQKRQEQKEIKKRHVYVGLKIMVGLSVVGVMLMLYGLYHSQFRGAMNTVFCGVGSLDFQQPIQEIQTFTQEFAQHYNNIRPMDIHSNSLKFLQTVDYSQQLLKALQQSGQNDNLKLINQLKQVVLNLNNSWLSYQQLRQNNVVFNQTIQLLKYVFRRITIHREVITQYVNKHVSMEDLPYHFNALTNILYLFVLVSFIYVAIIAALFLINNKVVLFINAHSLPYLLTIITIFSFSIAIFISIYSPVLLIYHQSMQSGLRFPDQLLLEAPKLGLPYKGVAFQSQNKKVLELVKVLFYKRYNIQNILEGQTYRSALHYSQALQPFAHLHDDYLQKLFKEAESKVDPTKLKQNIYNAKYMEKVLFEQHFASWLMINLKQHLKATRQIIQGQFLNKPKIGIKENKLLNFKYLLQPAEVALIVESVKARSLFYKIGYIALLALICQIIIQNSVANTNISQHYSTFKKLNQSSAAHLQEQTVGIQPSDKIQPVNKQEKVELWQSS